jgi:hypothetical protein
VLVSNQRSREAGSSSGFWFDLVLHAATPVSSLLIAHAN